MYFTTNIVKCKAKTRVGNIKKVFNRKTSLTRPKAFLQVMIK